ncbi:MAG TPA: DinB family protein [Candidatus Cybelea sp.]|nr:DinB family protein [Candidatus Cybelea sp.]
MALRDGLLAEFDHEMVGTRKTLERVPEGKPDWVPHPKSMKMARLAGHLAELPGWIVETIERESLDVRPPNGPPFQPFVMTSRQQLLDKFDKSVVAARAALREASDELLMAPWTLLAGGQKVFSIPRLAVVRGMVLSHVIHHRAQLGVYLRMNDVPVPSLYGPSADEGQM